MPGLKITKFKQMAKCELREIYGSGDVDGFNDLLERKLGFMIANANWRPVGISDGSVVIEVEGDVVSDEESEDA